ncbi:hypothetical protein TNCV_1035061 [Trichonephila clavipes]|nr:hypothetical protein TNCV_1035061 [Trichonephila clavipes]
MYSAFARHEGTLNSRRDASSLMRLAAGDERWEAPDPLPGCFPQNWCGTELNRPVTCMMFKAKVNVGRTSSPLSW